MTDAPTYTGSLRRGDQPGTVVGELLDIFGWKIHILGTRQDDGSYLLVATVGDKGSLRVPAVDGEG